MTIFFYCAALRRELTNQPTNELSFVCTIIARIAGGALNRPGADDPAIGYLLQNQLISHPTV
jgi:hypothetical protein